MQVALLGSLESPKHEEVAIKLGGWAGTEKSPKPRLLSRRAYRAIEMGRLRNFVQPTLELFTMPYKNSRYFNVPMTRDLSHVATILAKSWGVHIPFGPYDYVTTVIAARFYRKTDPSWVVFRAPTFEYEYDMTRDPSPRNRKSH